MTDYKIEMDNLKGTTVEIHSNNKIIASRIEIAVDHIFKEFQKEQEK